MQQTPKGGGWGWGVEEEYAGRIGKTVSQILMVESLLGNCDYLSIYDRIHEVEKKGEHDGRIEKLFSRVLNLG